MWILPMTAKALWMMMPPKTEQDDELDEAETVEEEARANQR